MVLTPRRVLGYAVRDEIRARNIEVHSFYNEEALEEEEAQRAFALLSLLINIEDRVALRWWLGHGSPSRRRSAYKRLREHCEQSGLSPKAALDACLVGQLLIPNAADLVGKYRELVQVLDDLRTRQLADLVDELFPEGSDACSVLREAALLALEEIETADKLFDRLRTVVTQPAIPEKADYVRVMSLHKSKGLTSKVAIVSGCVQGLIPFVNREAPAAEAEAVLQEQRRLFYVAITRCTETLVVSSFSRLPRQLAWKLRALVVPGPGTDAPTIASEFLSELGPTAPSAKQGPIWAQNDYQE